MAFDPIEGPIPVNWVQTTVGAACFPGAGGVQTGPFGSQLHASDYVPDGVPSIMPKNLSGDRVSTDDIARVRSQDVERLSRHKVEPGDIVYSRRGDVERRALITERESGWLCGTGCLRVRLANPDIHPSYLYFYLGHPSVRGWIVRHAHGATMPNLNTSILSALPLSYPQRDEQRRIAAVLGALDEKIELNRKMNQTLEAMAQALFKSWFVNFDPVIDNALRACNPIPDDLVDKAERRKEVMARDTYSVPEYAGLFPDTFENSELGSIPAGWRASTLGQEAERCDGLIQTGPPFGSQLHAADYVDVGIPVMMPKNIQNTRISTDSIARITDDDADRLARHRVQEGDLVYSRRGDVEKHAPIGPREIGWLCGTGCLLVRPGAGWPSPLYTSLSLNQPDIRTWISQHAIGATMPNLNTGILSAVPLLAPPDALIESFAELTRPMNKRSVSNDAENESLSAIRDALLPKLISGEVRVPEDVQPADAIAVEAAP